MTGPITALATAHRRMICGRHARLAGLPERPDFEDVEAAMILRRELDELGYRIVLKEDEQ